MGSFICHGKRALIPAPILSPPLSPTTPKPARSTADRTSTYTYGTAAQCSAAPLLPSFLNKPLLPVPHRSPGAIIVHRI
jgi:hypothetical protein